MGVTYENGKYRARVSVGGNKRRSLGRFDTKLKAQRAVSKYRSEQAREKAYEAELQENLDNPTEGGTLLEQYAAAHPIDPTPEKKASLWDRIKSSWRG